MNGRTRSGKGQPRCLRAIRHQERTDTQISNVKSAEETTEMYEPLQLQELTYI
jgi:hypothetical protein